MLLEFHIQYGQATVFLKENSDWARIQEAADEKNSQTNEIFFIQNYLVFLAEILYGALMVHWFFRIMKLKKM